MEERPQTQLFSRTTWCCDLTRAGEALCAPLPTGI
ncbi:hypothetical protein [Ponticoccus alexandrii]